MDRLFHNENMADTWFTSDFHFGHFNIIRYCNRPFTSTEEMDTCIVDRMNQCVKSNDTRKRHLTTVLCEAGF
jgi:calcineurin-like phosphoesterase family protein